MLSNCSELLVPGGVPPPASLPEGPLLNHLYQLQSSYLRANSDDSVINFHMLHFA